MGLIDAQNELSDAQAVTVTAVSTNVIDMNQATPRYAGGEDLNLDVTVNTAFAGGTSIQVKVWTDDTTTVTNGEAIYTGPAVLTAAATAGKKLATISLHHKDLQQYVGVQYVVVGTMTAGAVDANYMITPQSDAPNLS
jgi:hypothetical protein